MMAHLGSIPAFVAPRSRDAGLPGGPVSLSREPYPSHTGTFLARCAGDQATVEQVYDVAREVLSCDQRFSGCAAALMPPWGHGPPLDEATHGRLSRYVTDDLVSLMPRPINIVHFSGLLASCYAQRCGHLTCTKGANGPVYALAPETTTHSSAAIKRDSLLINRHLRTYNANLASITIDGRLLAMRSARCDSPDKMEEKLLAACISALNAANGVPSDAVTGLHRHGDRWEFCPTIITAMDHSGFKSALSQMRDFVKHKAGSVARGDDERAMLNDLLAARNALFGCATPSDGRAARFITRRLSVCMGGEPTVVDVDIREPRIVQTVLSAFGNNPIDMLLANQANHHAARAMFMDLAAIWSARPDDGVAQAVGAIMMQVGPDKEEIEQFLRDCPGYAFYSALNDKQKMALGWLRLTLVGKDCAGERLLHPGDAARAAILLKYLCDELNHALLPECKSGLDRTLILVGLFGAAEQFERVYGRPFWPQSTGEDLAAFRCYFTHLADGCGADMVQAVRGAGRGVKWSGQAYRDWYAPELSELPGTLLEPRAMHVGVKLPDWMT